LTAGYGCCIAIVGLMRAARRAGSHEAAMAAIVSSGMPSAPKRSPLIVRC